MQATEIYNERLQVNKKVKILFYGRVKRLSYHLTDILKERPLLSEGAIVWCDLLLGSAEHSGIYVGNNKIVELTGDGVVREVGFEQFVSIGESLVRTGFTVYALCNKEGVLADPKIAERALDKRDDPRGYNLFTKNCHQFTAGCITGNFTNKTLTFEQLKWVTALHFGILSLTSRVVCEVKV
ncbi:hypothetical protein [Neobacillus vireti]|uniref:hypothetical protein n=1 Tax=Neobacillus vireti TaxID=220686 RepID=UPI003000AA5C